MVKVTVSGQYDMPRLPENTWCVIALSDSEYQGGEGLSPHVRPHLHLAMDDVWWEPDPEEPEGLQRPDSQHLMELRDFLHRVQPEHLHVACAAGVSRSPALALVAFMLLHPHLTARDAIHAVEQVRSVNIPNKYVLRHADRLFGFNLTEAVMEHLREQKGMPEMADRYAQMF